MSSAFTEAVEGQLNDDAKWWVDFGETFARRSFCLRSEIKRSTEQIGKRLADHVAVHESGIGPSRQFAAAPQLGRFRSEADMSP
jgi:hypothetical protein